MWMPEKLIREKNMHELMSHHGNWRMCYKQLKKTENVMVVLNTQIHCRNIMIIFRKQMKLEQF